MKYWGYLAIKLAVAAAVLRAAWLGLVWWIPEPEPFVRWNQEVRFSRFGQDLPWTLAIMLYGLAAAAVLYLVILDQRYRCRTCARRLRMPVVTGSWARMLTFGPPRTEYICPYGHGTLKVPDLQISGIELPDWKSNQDIWTELESLEEASRK